jgi:hypothetical protein
MALVVLGGCVEPGRLPKEMESLLDIINVLN